MEIRAIIILFSSFFFFSLSLTVEHQQARQFRQPGFVIDSQTDNTRHQPICNPSALLGL
jgi:hypothetical protein